MKPIKYFLTAGIALLCGIQFLSAQERWVIYPHPLYPFSKYDGDTVKYLRQNFDGGANDDYMGKPISQYIEAIDPALPIKTCFPYYFAGYKDVSLLGFYGMIYTKDQLKQMIKEGKKIYAIGLLFEKGLDSDREPDVYNYVRNLGLGKILPWTPELQQKIGHIPYGNNAVQDMTSEVQRYLENYPD